MKFKIMILTSILAVAAISAAPLSYAGDVRVFVRHQVADYKVWRKVYDGLAKFQKEHGVFYRAVYQSADDPNDVTVVHDFHSIEKARAFVADPELKAAMEKSGVKGPPQIVVTVRAAK